MDAELINEFLNESRELLENIEPQLVELHHSVQTTGEINKEQLNEIFRLFHSLKGTSGFLGLENIIAVAHRAENLLDAIRSESMTLIAAHTSALCGACDLVHLLLEKVEVSSGDSGLEEQVASISDVFDRLLSGEALNAEPTRVLTSVSLSPPEKDPSSSGDKESTSRNGAEPSQATTLRKGGDSLRVDLSRLDQLNDLIGELVIAESIIQKRLGGARGSAYSRADREAIQLRRVVNQLRDLSVSIRMVPVGNHFRRLIRLVHELGQVSGKQVDIMISGEDTEIDKTVLEMIMDPVVHIIRNSVDHGIETPDEREAIGKHRVGRIAIDASHHGGSVWVKITDDGQGLNRKKIIKRATEVGLLSEPDEDLREQDLADLLCTPGFSTADSVTDISGRGVGMDVVRRNIEQIQGTLTIDSVPGEGCTINIRIPLTLSIIQGMNIRLGSEDYILPIHSIKRAFKPNTSLLATVSDNDELINYEGDVLPLIKLGRVFDVSDSAQELSEGIVVLVEDGVRTVALLIDSLEGQSQFVVKPVHSMVGAGGGFSAATITSNGEVCMIIDPGSMMSFAKGPADTAKSA